MKRIPLFLVLVLAFAACGGELDPDDPDNRKVVVLDVKGMT
jgi:hypothetical protein